MDKQHKKGGRPHARAGVLLAACACLVAAAGCTRGDDSAQGTAAKLETPAAGGLEGLRTKTQALIEQLRSPATSSTEVDAEARRLVEAALPVAGEIARERAECVEYITLVLDGAALMDALSAAQLERTWYHDGSVAPAPVLCQHAQNLVVRPVRTVARLREGDLSNARDELVADLDALLDDIEAIERRR